MARFDTNPNVGTMGNDNALNNSQTLLNNGICSKYLIKERSSLYPERFSRQGDISIDESKNIFNEIKANNLLDANNYFKGYSEDMQSAYSNNKTAFQQINNLTPAQKQEVLEEISLSVLDHHMYSDFNKATIKFLNTQCK